MTKSNIIAVLKDRVSRHLEVPEELKGTAEGKLLAVNNVLKMKDFIYKNTNELLAKCTEDFGEVFLIELDREITRHFEQEVNKVTDMVGEPRIDFVNDRYLPNS